MGKSQKTRTDFKEKQLSFFRILYQPELDDTDKLTDGQQIRIFQKNDGHLVMKFFDDLNLMLEYCNSTSRSADTYFSLSTTNGTSGQAGDLVKRTVLAFDFDGKEQGITASDVMYRFGLLKLHYHALIDSGHGYHAYMCIEPTGDHQVIEQLQCELCDRLQADPNATRKTQLMRVPGTLNLKADPLPVNVIQLYGLDTIRRYNIDRLHRRFCRAERPKDAPARTILATTIIPPCIERTIENGTDEGKRNSDLVTLVVTLRKRGKTLGQILALCRTWATASQFDDSLEYRVKYIYENQNNVKMDCTGCQHYADCWYRIESDFDFPDDIVLLNFSESHVKTLLPKHQGARQMKPNDLLIYCILLCHHDGLTFTEIMKQLSYRGRPALCERTARAALTNLVDNRFVRAADTGSQHERIYTAVSGIWQPDLTFNVSFAATDAAIMQRISPEELRLYTYMRYLHHQKQRTDPGALRGNLFQCNQLTLAEDLQVTQGRISQMTANLLQEHLLSEWYRRPSKQTNFDYIVYRLCY